MENIKISAVKVSAKIPETNLKSVELFCKQNGIRYKWFNRGQHIIVFDRSYTFTIFKNCSSSLADQHVNITKLKNLNISSAIEDLAWILDVEPKKIFAIVDNITAVGNLEKQIDLEDFIRDNDDLTDFIQYQPERFPGLFIRGQYGKIILFKSGKMVHISIHLFYLSSFKR